MKELDIKRFLNAANPTKALAIENEEDRKFYIDFSSVRGGAVIQELKDSIADPLFGTPDEPTCQLFTGHIGCGKSTELLRLKKELQDGGFHVVYFESDKDLELGDVDVGDILLSIARHVSESLEARQIHLQTTGFKKLLQDLWKVLNAEVTGVKLKTPILGEIGYKTKGDEFSISLAIGEVTSKTKASTPLREKLRGFLEPRSRDLIDAINSELLEPAIDILKQGGQKGLVVIVDNLDRVYPSSKPWGRLQTEYLFIDRSVQLRGLNCHLIYTIPISLRFSSEYAVLTSRFMGQEPKVLEMVAVQSRSGNKPLVEGMALLREMVLARAFPELDPKQRKLEARQPQESLYIQKIVDSEKTLDSLCLISGGHVRRLLNLLYEWIRKERQLPLTHLTLESLIQSRGNSSVLTLKPDGWNLLRRVAETHKVEPDENYQVLIRGLYVYEYRDSEGFWFDVDPILRETKEFRT